MFGRITGFAKEINSRICGISIYPLIICYLRYISRQCNVSGINIFFFDISIGVGFDKTVSIRTIPIDNRCITKDTIIRRFQFIIDKVNYSISGSAYIFHMS